MRPRLKSDTFFIPVNDGVYIRNNENSFVLKGKALATWLERLAPALDGQRDLDELCKAVSEEKRPLLIRLIELLKEHGYIKDVTQDRPHTLSTRLADLYAPAITFIDYHTDSAGYRFQQFLSMPVLAIGSGETLLALAHTLLETGNQSISLLDTGEENTNYERLQELLYISQTERDSALTLNIIKSDAWKNTTTNDTWSNHKDQLYRLCTFSSMVLYFSTAADSIQHAHDLTEICQQARVPFLPAVVLTNEIYVGPLHRPDQHGCWQCYWRRWQAAHGFPAYAQDGRPFIAEHITKAPDLGKAAIGIVANILALEFFKYSTNVKRNTLDEQVHVLELERLQNIKHQLFPHPLCAVCSPSCQATEFNAQAEKDSQHTQTQQDHSLPRSVLCMKSEIARLRELQSPPSIDDVLQLTDQWVDINSGIVTRIDDMDYIQLPLIRSQVTIPLSFNKSYELPVIKAAGLDYAEVRLIAIRKAVACYLESLADEHRALRGRCQQSGTKVEIIQPDCIFGWLRTPSVNLDKLTWTWASRLDNDDAIVLVPGAAIAPRSSWNQWQDSSLFATETPGTGLGGTWNEALAAGLLNLSAALISARVSRSDLLKTARPIAQTAYSADSLCAAYLSMLEILGGQVALVDVTDYSDAYKLPQIAAYLDEQWLDTFTHWHPLYAIRDALQAAVLTLQIQRTSGAGEQTAWQDRLPSPFVSTSVPVIEKQLQAELPPALADEADNVAAIAVLHAHLKQRGWNVVVAPLARDVTVSRLLPCALRVLAVRQSSERGK